MNNDYHYAEANSKQSDRIKHKSNYTKKNTNLNAQVQNKSFLNKCQLSQMKPRHIDSSRALCGTFNRPGKVVG